MKLENMPLNTNGKIDRNVLPSPDIDIVTGSVYEAARNETEEALVKIWEEVLGVNNIGINDNFFELGGHSLKATILVGRINKELEVEVPLKVIFDCENIKGLSEYISVTSRKEYEKIGKVEEKEYYEASSAQKRVYMLQELDKESTAYNIPGVIEIQGSLDLERLNKTFLKLIERHETLRTSFETIDDNIIQKIHKMKSIEFKIEEIKAEDEAEIKDQINKFIQPFKLDKAPLLRIGLIKIKKDRHILVFDMHHIISDGISMRILTKEFGAIYSGKELEKLKIQYKDYSEWQLKKRRSEEFRRQEEYWLNEFREAIPVLNLPTDYKRPKIKNFKGSSIKFTLNKEMTRRLRNLAKETGTTMYMVLLASVNILLSKYSGQEEIIVGTPIAGRKHRDLENIIGMFVNTLVIRNNINAKLSFKDYLKVIKEKALMAYENQDYQFEDLVDKLEVVRDLSRNPLFDVMFVLQNMEESNVEIENLIFRPYEQKNDVEKFDITINAVEGMSKIYFTLSYATSLYKHETMERMAKHFINVIKEILRNIEVKIDDINLLDQDEKNKLLIEFNKTVSDYPENKTINELFEEEVNKNPNNIVAVFEENEITYKEFNEKANSLARILRKKGIGPDDIVGIISEHSLNMIVGIMAVIKAGGAYLPIDPYYPENRIEYILNNSKAKIILIQNKFKEKIKCEALIYDLDDEKLYKGDGTNLNKTANGSNLAYLIYTSGTTGKPKGVMIENKALINYALYAKEHYLNEQDVYMPLYTSIAFDLTITSIFAPLISGNKIVIYEEKDINVLMKKVFQSNKEAVIKATPAHLSLLKEIPNINRKIKKIIVGGEELKEELSKKISDIFHNQIEIINEYGPTEATVGCIAHKYNYRKEYDNTVFIGKPINNFHIYIVDKKNKIVPIGIIGEICISGAGLARGYLKNKKLTEEKFIENPYEIGQRMYKTGDLARWLPDGNIEYLGRMDNQVKIRGFRIELGEIESTLLNIDGINEAVVLDNDKDGSNYLCAYYVAEKEYSAEKLREKLKNLLPDYMIPSYFISLENIPLTKNGKVDKNSLPNPKDEINIEVKYEKPKNEIEEKLVKIWQDVLGVSKIGINDNFFDLGGHSLNATIVVSRISKQLNVEVPLREIFILGTIKSLSKYILLANKENYEKIPKAEEKEYYEASSAQKRIYVLQQFDKESTAYNIPGAIEIKGRLDIEKLNKTFSKLIERHETLRTSFKTINDDIIQKIHKIESIKFKIEEIEVKDESEIREKVSDFIKCFDLSKAPLIRVGLIELKEDRYILIFDMHHIISDGISMGILTKEFGEIYGGKELEGLKLQYKDYSEWQNKIQQKEEFKKQESYWLKEFEGEIPILNMPTDYNRPLVQSFKGDSIDFTIGKEETKILREIARESGSTMYMVLLSAFKVLLSKYSGQEEIIVGTPIAGRYHSDLENIIGMFVNTLAIRSTINEEDTYEDYLYKIKDKLFSAYENQDYQLENIVEKVNVKRESNRNPLFDIAFTMQNMDSGLIKIDELKFRKYNLGDNTAKFDITMTAVEINDCIYLNLCYATKLYRKETIERFKESYLAIVAQIIINRRLKIKDIKIISEKETEKILLNFNNTKVNYKRNKTIQELFEEQVLKTPNNIVVIFGDKKLTYNELNQKANSLARILREKGVEQDVIVGIMPERSIEMVVGIMAILKAGGAYLPIDIQYPKDRIIYMLKDSNVKILLEQNSSIDITGLKCEVLNLNNDKLFNSNNNNNLKILNHSNDMAYIVYTSGTTGKPKGVIIEHEGIVNLSNFFTNDLKISSDKKILQFASIAFDAFSWELYMAILCGAELHIIPKEVSMNMLLLNNYIKRNELNILTLPPFIADKIDINDSKIQLVITAGSEVKKVLVNKLCKKVKYINAYGPTESTICTTIWRYEKNLNDTVPIGKPINNIRVYIMDKNNNLQPIGVPGELCISGDGLARGYLNRPELTSEKFIENPYKIGERIYKTGDLARWLPDGNVEFLGRIDHQVKIRGFRIELGEIETRLLEIEGIKEVTVLANDNDENKFLCAYYVGERRYTVSEFRSILNNSLPEYMIPSYFIKLESMPLNTNGKIDRKALPNPEDDILTSSVYEAPRNDMEEKLVAIWSKFLKVSNIGINDNFFELGGNSLKAIQLTIAMNSDFDVEVNDIFKNQTIKNLAQNISYNKGKLKKQIQKIKDIIVSKDKLNNYDFNELRKEAYLKYNERCILDRKINLEQRKYYKNILLIGATGYLGIYILKTLLETSNSNIYLIIRGRDNKEAEKRLIEKFEYYFDEKIYGDYSQRINVLCGDITKNEFGLDYLDYNRLTKTIDCVLNSAANVKHYGNYEDFYDINVLAVSNLLEFCYQNKKKDFNHISTLSVGSGHIENSKYRLFTEFDIDENQIIKNYYIKSKLEAEKLILKARQKGINTNIFRVGNLVFDSTSGRFQKNIEDNNFYEFIKSLIEFGSYPGFGAFYYDFSFIDHTAKAITLLFNVIELSNQVYHISNPNKISLVNVCELIQKYEPNFKKRKTEDFLNELYLSFENNSFKYNISKIIMNLNILGDGRETTNFEITSKRTNDLLKKVGFSWDIVDEIHIKRMIDHCKKIGYI
ncbi:non-ribosomal peptide synthetase [Clostridium cavendishii]|nr:non-ribosomal peptide synthetase [Clostridium cavendishii]